MEDSDFAKAIRQADLRLRDIIQHRLAGRQALAEPRLTDEEIEALIIFIASRGFVQKV